MRSILMGVLAIFAVSSIATWTSSEADAASRHYKKKPGYGHGQAYGRYYYQRRPPSVAANGLCQRDTGTATSDLNFRNRCDTEEFWTRMQEQGSGRR